MLNATIEDAIILSTSAVAKFKNIETTHRVIHLNEVDIVRYIKSKILKLSKRMVGLSANNRNEYFNISRKLSKLKTELYRQNRAHGILNFYTEGN